MVETKYNCTQCNKSYNSKHDAIVCDSTHVLLTHSDVYWYIPLLAWFMVPYKLFTIKNSILVFNPNKTIFGEILGLCRIWWMFFSPIVLLMLLCVKWN